ncbi:UNKNOWN [Stylonychia lemnae]|uniref:Uncharacterized protein n=1 Tax=Stylonychia lemnae TaxID=5949 RepID=A0A078B0R5_STYLE|nr:UNKNOWN [Stylonychia lemnae]|eukprot:CDW86708.1 UNKNOWN [Stylonychia lemnae]
MMSKLKTISEIHRQDIRATIINSDKNHYEMYKVYLNNAEKKFKGEIDLLKGQLKRFNLETFSTQKIIFKLSTIIIYMEQFFDEIKLKFETNDYNGVAQLLGVKFNKSRKTQSRKQLEEDIRNLKFNAENQISEKPLKGGFGSKKASFDISIQPPQTILSEDDEDQDLLDDISLRDQKISYLLQEISSYKQQLDQVKSEYKNLENYSDMISLDLERIRAKYSVSENRCKDLQKIIESMSKGHKDKFEDIQLMFFGKEQDLVSKINEEKARFDKFKSEIDIELKIKDTIIERLENYNKVLKNEITMGKRVLQDPRLSQIVSRNFRSNIQDFNQNDYFLKENSKVATILKEQDELRKNIEVQGIPDEVMRIRSDNYTPGILRIKQKMNNSVTIQSDTESINNTRNISMMQDTYQNLKSIKNEMPSTQNQQYRQQMVINHADIQNYFSQRKKSKTPFNKFRVAKQISIFDESQNSKQSQFSTFQDTSFQFAPSTRTTQRNVFSNDRQRNRTLLIEDKDSNILGNDVSLVLQHLKKKRELQ